MFSGVLLVLGTAATVRADVSDLLFTVRIDNSTSNNTPTIYVTNDSPTLEITRFELTIGNTSKNFDGSYKSLTPRPMAPRHRPRPPWVACLGWSTSAAMCWWFI